jgi:superfamily I DNA/RNA helicase
MPIIEILTGVAGSGKSERCRALLNEHGGAWLLLPSEELCARWRRRHPDRAAGIHTLPGLAHALAGPALEGREVVTPAFRLLIMRQLVREQVRPGDYFGQVAATAGFVRRLADLLSQLKQGETDADSLAGAVRAVGPHAADATFAAKGEEIAALQRSYNDYLEERRLCDAEDVIARAIGHIRQAGPASNGAQPPILLVDGFFAFTSLQLSFLRALAPSVHRLIVTLTHDTSRPILFARSAETLARLRETFPTAAVTELPAGHRPAATSLSLLERQLFRGEAPASPVDAAVSLFEAPDELMQVEMVAREIRRLLDGQGYRPREICLLARSVADLAPPNQKRVQPLRRPGLSARRPAPRRKPLRRLGLRPAAVLAARLAARRSAARPPLQLSRTGPVRR